MHGCRDHCTFTSVWNSPRSNSLGSSPLLPVSAALPLSGLSLFGTRPSEGEMLEVIWCYVRAQSLAWETAKETTHSRKNLAWSGLMLLLESVAKEARKTRSQPEHGMQIDTGPLLDLTEYAPLRIETLRSIRVFISECAPRMHLSPVGTKHIPLSRRKKWESGTVGRTRIHDPRFCGPLLYCCFRSRKLLKRGPGGIRTPDPRFRKPLLYPSELQAQALFSIVCRYSRSLSHSLGHS